MARRRRWLGPADLPAAIYHCTSRVVDRAFRFGAAERNHFVTLMRELADFCGVQILSYCILSNHFHIVVKVPRPPNPLPNAEQILVRISRLLGSSTASGVRQQFDALRQRGDKAGEALYLASFHRRMWNLSEFMKSLKQRFSRWYNLRNARRGTLWEERFGSVFVQEGRALVAVAGYVDLNPVRAGIVSDPRNYRWSGYGEAAGGSSAAREGIQAIVQSMLKGEVISARRALELYRLQVVGAGTDGECADRADALAKGARAREEIVRSLNGRSRLPLPEYLRCRVRYFCSAVAFGDQEFVESFFQENRDQFGGRRIHGARRLRGLDEDLYSIRDLRKDVFT